MWRRPFRKYHVLARLWRIDWPLMRQLVVVGAPISMSILLEYGLFSSAALLMGLISTTALAAHQVALQVTAILFMVPLGIGMAATVRVGHAVGRSDAAGSQARRLCRDVARHRARRRLHPHRRSSARFAIARLFFGDGATGAGTHRADRDAADGRRHLLHHRRHPDHRCRRAARHQRHPRAVVVCRRSATG